MNKLLATIGTLLITRIAGNLTSELSGLTDNISANIFKILRGVAFLGLSVISFGISLFFVGVLVFLIIGGFDPYIEAAGWTLGITLLISVIFLLTGLNLLQKK